MMLTVGPLSVLQFENICFCVLGKDVAVDVGSSEEEAKKALTRQRQVVVTGLGVVSAIGDDPDVYYTNLLEGVNGISEIQAFDCSELPSV